MYSTQLGVDGSGFMFDQRVGVILDCVGIDCGERLSPLNIYFHFSYIHCNPISTKLLSYFVVRKFVF